MPIQTTSSHQDGGSRGDQHEHGGHAHHDLPTSGRALWAVSISATLHCLTGCAIGEVSGMGIGTAFGPSNGATVVLSVLLAFVFGYSLTSLPLLRAELALGAVIPIAFASDSFSIATMELIDIAVVVAIPGAMDAGLATLPFWGSLSFSLAVAFVAAVPVNRWLIARGKGHAAVHRTGIHGGPNPRLVGAALAVGFVFGAAVLIAQARDGDSGSASRGMSMVELRPVTPMIASPPSAVRPNLGRRLRVTATGDVRVGADV